MKRQIKSIDEYIATFPKDTQTLLQEVRKTIQKTAPSSTETMSYGIPTFDLNGKHMVHFAAFKDHIGFYPTPSGIEAFKRDIAPYKWAKGSVQFPFSKPTPFDLIKKIVLFRADEIEKGKK